MHAGLSVGKERVMRKSADSTEMPFGMVDWAGPKNHALDGDTTTIR